MKNFCDDCDDPIISHECAEAWGHMEYWDEIVCEPGEMCRHLKKYKSMVQEYDSTEILIEVQEQLEGVV
jgi:hypothetical protein